MACFFALLLFFICSWIFCCCRNFRKNTVYENLEITETIVNVVVSGRIDMKINFERCTAESLLQMYRHYFETEDLPAGFEPSRLPEQRWTPAEATQIFLNNLYDPPQSLEDLVRLEPATLVGGHMTDTESTTTVRTAATSLWLWGPSVGEKAPPSPERQYRGRGRVRGRRGGRRSEIYH